MVAPPGTDLENLKRWLPKGILPETIEPAPTSANETEKGIALTELLGRVKGVIDEGFPRAVWVRAEISELRGKNGHLYLTLCERNDQGDNLAQTKGIIWRNRAENLTAKFEGSQDERGMPGVGFRHITNPPEPPRRLVPTIPWVRQVT